MRSSIRLLLAATLSAVLAACGSGGGGTATPSGSAVPTSAKQLRARLLTVSDLGAADWKLASPVNTADLASVGQSIPCRSDALSPAVAKRLTAVTGVQFEPTNRSYRHAIELVITGEPAQLGGDLQLLFTAMDSCATTAPGTAKLTVTRLSLPALGDQRGGYVSAAEVGTAQSSGTWYTREAAVRIGPVAVVLGMTEILPTPRSKPQTSDEAFRQLLRTAVSKLAA